MVIAIIFVYYLIIGSLIFSRWRYMHKFGLINKIILGMLFVTLSLLLSAKNGAFYNFELFIILGLFCNSIGDIFLGMCKVEKRNSEFYFYIALVIITISQIVYLFASIQLESFNFESLFISIFFVILMYLIFNKIVKGTTRAKFALFYAYPLTIVVINSLINLLSNSHSKLIIFSIGVTLYWLSDIILFVIKFKVQNRIYDSINKVLYYTAQLLIAFSIIF
ncbi:lysoplasmalogenase family protein [Oceanirhabdus sp. W0125-5]|uniref:lysoplasmalogenase family protein n=1 Tax=Oceanirhabdus sp. W0125-5 TaxID=2999116 RepID=UPI0022F32456|nr:lysoplasmalogenase family protein [Oceanirhabdus sp. W0125-5]WBW95667.1 lysoplasmalogenase family protein [Oceanirhabdus sp. W0125-5]